MSAPPHPAAAGAGTDSGLLCLVIIARYLGVAADADRLRHELGGGDRHLGEVELLRAARRLGLKARVVRGRWTRLAAAPLPAIAVQRDGSCVVVSRADAATVHVHDPLASRPRALDRAAFEQSWTRRLILVTRRTPGAAAGRPFGFAWFVPVIVKYRTLLGEVLAASLFLQLFALVTPLFTQVVIDKVLVHKGLTTLHVLAAGMLAVALFEALLGGLRTYLFAHTSSRIDVELGATLFGHVLALPLAYFEARRVGDTSARVRELDTIRQFLTGTTVTLVIDLLFTVVFLAVMLGYSSLLTGIVLAALPGYAVLSGAVTPLLRARLHDKFDRGAESQAFLVESITGIQTVKALAVEPEMQRRWEDLLAGHVRASFRAVSLASIAGQVGGLLAKTVTIAILWTGAQAVMREQLSVGELIAFNMLAGRVTGPVLRIVQLWQEFQQAGIAVARLGDLLNAPREPSAPPSRPAPPALAGRVVFEDVTFRYRLDRAEVLRSVSFSVPPGRIVGIVGRSGSGKSTIARLIQRLYVPERGRVLVDGMDVAQLDPAWLRRRVGVVLQESFLFDRSVRENIALGDPGIPMERVVRAAALAGAHEFVMDLPEGYDTRVGEHGCQLSGGQRQRIAIARALVTDPRILILDEATSALDYESEHLIQQNLAQICAGRTVFIVAHRLSTVRPAHRIFVIEAGSLVEEGTHAELIQRGGQYARLYRYQGNPPLPATGAGAGRPPAAAGGRLGGAEPRGAS